MLYDPKWEIQTKAKPFSLENLVAWLRTMPTDRTYSYLNCDGRCLYGQYARMHGIAWDESGAVGRPASAPERYDFCCWVYANVASARPHTFGAALVRAQEAMAAR